mgnify:CR=1 FL=1
MLLFVIFFTLFMLDFTFLFVNVRFKFGPEFFRGVVAYLMNIHVFCRIFVETFKNVFLNLEHREYPSLGAPDIFLRVLL